MACKLRPWRIEDAHALAEIIDNKKVQDQLRDGLPYPYTVADARAYITAVGQADAQATYAFAITVDDRAVGCIAALRQANIHARTAEIGYYIGEPYWGNGIGTSAVKQLCGYLFRHTDLLRIFAQPFAHNAASCRLLEKCGFAYEGTLRKNAVKNGVAVDMKIYSMLNDDI